MGSDFAGEAFKVVVLMWGVSKVNWAEAAFQARERAEAHDEDVQENEKLEVAAYGSPAGYASPLATKAALASPGAASPGLMTGTAAQNFEAASPGETFTRSPNPSAADKL